MPRFLSLDYLFEVQTIKRSVLSRCLMTSTNLECNDTYAHDGTLEDYTYRTPWQRANVMVDTDWCLAEQIRTLDVSCTGMLEPVQKFREHYGQTNCVDTEVVPSSNPDSPPVTSGDLLSIKERLHTISDTIINIKSKGNMNKYVEVPVVAVLKNSLPSVESLASRLKSNVVQDPFIQEDGTDITEQQIIRRDKLYDNKNTDERSNTMYYEQFEEEFQENDVEDYLLEEIVVNDVFKRIWVYVNNDLPQEDAIGLLDDDINKLELGRSTLGESYNNSSKFANKQSPEEVFIQINESGQLCHEQSLNKHLILESPAKSDIIQLPSFPQQLLETLKKETLPIFNFPVLMSAETINKLQQAMWTKEKFFQDISTLILKVPATEADVTRNLIEEAHMILKTRTEQCSGEIELNLSWDPVASITCVNRGLAVPESLDTEPSTEVKVLAKVEEFYPIEYIEAVNKELDSSGDEVDEKSNDTNEDINDDFKMNIATSNRSENEVDNEMDVVITEENILVDFDKTYITGDSYSENENRLHVILMGNVLNEVDGEVELNKSEKDAVNVENKLNKTTLDKVIELNEEKILQSPLKKELIKEEHAANTENIKDEKRKRSLHRRNEELNKPENEEQGVDEQLVKNEQIKRRKIMDKNIKSSIHRKNSVDEFFMLRTGKKAGMSVYDNKTMGKKSEEMKTGVIEKVSDDIEMWKNMKTKRQEHIGPFKVDEKPAMRQIPEQPTHQKEKQRKKIKIINIILPEYYRELLNLLERKAQPVLGPLKDTGLVDQSITFLTLKPSSTRFMLKQQLIEHLNNANKYKLTILLHALVSSADLMCRCDLTTAYIHLRAVADKYRDMIDADLEYVLDCMLYTLRKIAKEQVDSPKVTELLVQLDCWFTRKVTKEGTDQQPKILIIISYDVPSLINSICKSIGRFPCFVCKCIDEGSVGYSNISSQLDYCNCLILKESQIGEDFPWAHFSLVVEYDYQSESPWEQMCLRQNIRYIAFKIALPAETPKQEEAELNEKDTVHTVVSSNTVTSNNELLHLLEAKYNIQVLERDYSSTYQAFPDIIIDERTCIVLLSTNHLTDGNAVESVTNRIARLSLQCCSCFLLIYNYDVSNSYTYTGKTVNNLARLHAVTAQYSRTNMDYEVKILYSFSTEQTAKIVRYIADKTAESVYTSEKCLKQLQLSEDMSKQERFLLSLSCFNSISAQRVLSSSTLKSISQMTLPYMVEVFPCLPVKVLEGLHSMLHCNEEKKPKLELPFHQNIPVDYKTKRENILPMFRQHHTDIKNEPHEPELFRNKIHNVTDFKNLSFENLKSGFNDKYGGLEPQQHISVEHSLSGNQFPHVMNYLQMPSLEDTAPISKATIPNTMHRGVSTYRSDVYDHFELEMFSDRDFGDNYQHFPAYTAQMQTRSDKWNIPELPTVNNCSVTGACNSDINPGIDFQTWNNYSVSGAYSESSINNPVQHLYGSNNANHGMNAIEAANFSFSGQIHHGLMPDDQ